MLIDIFFVWMRPDALETGDNSACLSPHLLLLIQKSLWKYFLVVEYEARCFQLSHRRVLVKCDKTPRSMLLFPG